MPSRSIAHRQSAPRRYRMTAGYRLFLGLPFNLWAIVYLYLTSDNLPYEKIGDEVRSLADLAPFEIPLSWEWCRVGDLFSNMSGLAYKKDALAIKADKMIRVLRGGNIGEEQFLFKGDDVFISSEFVKPELYLRKNYMITPAVSSLDHIGKIALIDKDYSDTVVGGFVLMLIPHFNDDVVSQYLLYAFATKHHRDNCRNITHKSGQAFYNLSREQMMNLPVPIPPREEMRRIIAMLKRVLPKVADYAVVDTALQNLNGSFPETLKKSILQEAVQGKLVPQDPSDEPAEALLERIRAEKQRLIKEGKIKKDKHESVIFRRDNSHYEKLDGVERCIDDELPFEIPNSWHWVRLSDICEYIQRGKSPKYSQIKKYPVIAQKCNQWRGFSIEKAQFVEPESICTYGQERFLQDNDLMWNSTGLGTLGRTAIYKCELNPYGSAVANSHVTVIRPMKEFVLPQYLYFYFSNPTVQSVIEDQADGTTKQKELSTTTVRSYLVPLPPYN